MGRLGTNETKYKLTVDSLNKFVSDIEKKNKQILEIEEERNSLKSNQHRYENELEDVFNFQVYLSTKKHENNQILHLAKKIDGGTLKRLFPVFEKLKLKTSVLFK